MKPEGFKELIIWQKAFALTLEAYETTKAFPREAQYGLVSQLRRAAVSVAANMRKAMNDNTARNMCSF
jgi:four helix bundle protein